MKSFYSSAVDSLEEIRTVDASGVVVPLVPSRAAARGRIATYDAPSAAPRVEDIRLESVPEFIETLSSRVYDIARAQGGTIPFTVIREIAENLIHADFNEPVVSVLDSGQTIRFADQGPGIADKDKALLPGFTTANREMKRFIRGVGSGLPLVREFLLNSGGSLVVEDNLCRGSVVTIVAGHLERPAPRRELPAPPPDPTVFEVSHSVEHESLLDPDISAPVAGPRLSTRQKHVLALVLESGLAGPSLVAKELGVGVSTAYRDLALLEDAGLIISDSGKRTLTQRGLSYLGSLSDQT